MSRFIETIQIKNGKIPLLKYHNQRFNKTRNHFFGTDDIDLQDHIDVPKYLQSHIAKCRIIYDESILSIAYSPYSIKPITSLKLVSTEKDYSHKYEDRSELKRLYNLREAADDVLISKEGFITDTYYCNVAFLQNGKWLTPTIPLLEGTRRSSLLSEGKIQEAEIKISDIPTFEKVMLFNAMIGYGEVLVDCNNVFS